MKGLPIFTMSECILPYAPASFIQSNGSLKMVSHSDRHDSDISIGVDGSIDNFLTWSRDPNQSSIAYTVFHIDMYGDGILIMASHDYSPGTYYTPVCIYPDQSTTAGAASANLNYNISDKIGSTSYYKYEYALQAIFNGNNYDIYDLNGNPNPVKLASCNYFAIDGITFGDRYAIFAYYAFEK